ncbi:MAG TPA: monovalent cation/H(+) antiporter subunit G [Trebonia sp.]|nr:monovalent cation/H(+) antiporter subunit G [Trebonia sp.]
MAASIVADILLGLAALVVLLASVGIAVMPGAYAKLHFVTPVTVVAPALVTLAVLVQAGLSENAGQSVLALVFLIIGGPFLSHATIRAVRMRETGDWRHPARGIKPGEEKEQ